MFQGNRATLDSKEYRQSAENLMCCLLSQGKLEEILPLYLPLCKSSIFWSILLTYVNGWTLSCSIYCYVVYCGGCGDLGDGVVWHVCVGGGGGGG